MISCGVAVQLSPAYGPLHCGNLRKERQLDAVARA